MPLKKIFQVDVGFDDEEDVYQAQIYSVSDQKVLVGSDKLLRGLMSKVSKQIRKKGIDLKKFPLPEPKEESRIVTLNGN